MANEQSNTPTTGSETQELLPANASTKTPKRSDTSSTSDNQQSQHVRASTNVLGDADRYAPNSSRQFLADTPAPSFQSQNFQHNFATIKASETSVLGNIGHEQQQLWPEKQNSLSKDGSLSKMVELHERKLMELYARLDKFDEKLHTTQETHESFPFDILMKAKNTDILLPLRSVIKYFNRTPTGTVETPKSDIGTPIRRPDPEAIPVPPRPGPLLVNSEVEVENLRLQKLVADLTTKQEALQLENARLNITVSNTEDLRLNQEDLRLNHENLCISYGELETTLRMHRCPNGDELELPDSQLHDSFEDLEMSIQELIDYCDTSSIGIDAMLDMSKVCLANDPPTWWNSKVPERARRFWLRGLVANILNAKFFERSFYDLDGNEQLESGLVNFENLIFGEGSGVGEKLALQWRARTFRLASELRNQDEQPLNPQRLEVYQILKPILEPLFVINTENSFDHIGSLQKICELALFCASLLRRSSSSYTWDQQSVPKKTKAPAVRVESMLIVNNGALSPPFNVFGEVLRLQQNGAPVQIMKPIVGIFTS